MPTLERSERGGVGRAIAFLLTAAAVVVGVGVAMNQGLGPFPTPEGCTARVQGVEVELDPEQSENAAVISAVGVRRGLPARAVSIALATAFQESKLHNLDHGDRDSVGLFQQRPSMGWGTEEQIADPYYAANRFYDELEKVHGYESMRITEAAQRVQRSGFPEAYDDHAEDARALASALTGYSPTRFSCVVHRSGRPGQAPAVRRDLRHAFGRLPVRLGGPGLNVPVRPRSQANNRLGWAVAHYLVAHANRLHIKEVAYDRKVWTAGKQSERGWRDEESRGPGVGRGRVHVVMHE
jgi:hypothetical protein